MIKGIIFYSVAASFAVLSFNYMSEGINAKKAYSNFKAKERSPHKIKVVNQIENFPISLEDFEIKHGLKKTKVNPKAKTNTNVIPVPEHVVEPKKILPDTLRIVDTVFKFKSKIKISKINNNE